MPESDGVAAVLFDMDGTLLNSRDALLAAFHDATREVLGTAYPVTREDADRVIQLSSKDVFRELAGGSPDLSLRIEQSFHSSYRGRSHELRLYPGVAEMLGALRAQGLALGVVTSKSRVRLDRDLSLNAIDHLLDLSVCGDEVPAAKPDPAPIVMALEMLELEPDRVMYVGDGANDVIAAHGARVRAVGAGYGFHPDACRAAGPDHWIEAPLELPPLLTSLASV